MTPRLPEGSCTSCGRPLAGTDHRRCELDPPRLCPRCGRRMRVQVLPLGYRATCPACQAGPAPKPVTVEECGVDDDNG